MAKQPKWPSLQEQLDAIKPGPGSALEKLIKDNQDFHLLRPEEAHDNIGIPLWLRVSWRKKHPEATYSAQDPTGGYPRVLKKVYAWMLRHQDLRSDSSKPATPSGEKGGTP